jgi:hypothetical protein
MGMVFERDKNMHIQLVEGCSIYELDERGSLEYIKKRSGGVIISRSTFFSIRRRVVKNESDCLSERLSIHIDRNMHTVTSGAPNSVNAGELFDSVLTALIMPAKTFSHKFTHVGESHTFVGFIPLWLEWLIIEPIF